MFNKEKKIQNNFPISPISDNICVFFIPGKHYVNGGIISIFTLCKYSRMFCKDYNFIISTLPGKNTYAKNTFFENNENVYRWEQVFNNLNKHKNIIFHIPENYLNTFIDSLSEQEINFLKNCSLQVNILNQNIEYMPDKPIIRKIYSITNDITQTTAHDRYSNQETCNKYGIPLHKFSTYLDIRPYSKYTARKKEKTIVFSPDANPYKDKLRHKLQQLLPEYKIIEPRNLPFEKYLQVIAQASFIITFGEGFDGYYNIPPRLNTVSFSVYNDSFFPSAEWKNLETCYSSYEEMYNNIVDDIKKYSSNNELYCKITSKHDHMREKLYGFELYKKNIVDFYKKNYTYRPNITLEKKDLISVIVTTYNHGNYIEEALDSIYSQKNAPNIEVIVANDCSQDNTKDILNRYKEKHPDIRIINRSENIGPQYNLKDLFERASGDFIAILEGDDSWKEDYLYKQYKALLSQQHAVMSFTDLKILKNKKLISIKHEKYRHFMGPEYSLLFCRPSNFSCCMYRRKVLDYIPDSYYENKKNFCAFFNFYALEHGGACYIDEPLMIYRYHENSLWSSLDNKKQVLQAINSLYRLSIEIPHKYDAIILQVINEITNGFKNVRTKNVEKRLLKITVPYSKKKKFKLTLTKIKKMY